MLPYLVERGEYRIILGDKGYISQQLQAELIETEATVLLPTLRSNQKQQFSRVRALKHWGLLMRMSNKFGSCLFGVFVNQCLGRPLMKLKDLVLA